MKSAYLLSTSQRVLSGEVALASSKSILNRALIIRSLCDTAFAIEPLTEADDAKVLLQMLASDEERLYAGHAGSSFRFMTARACLYDREVVLDASPQLQRRPIGPLVRALQQLGANISYENKEGFPPIRIKPSADFGMGRNELQMQAGVSSQYVTALALIAPYLKDGLTIQLLDDAVSASYIRMTLAMMKTFGVKCSWEKNIIRIDPGKYEAKDFAVEGDWSAASYYYGMAALADTVDLVVKGISTPSIQGDAVLPEIYKVFGVATEAVEGGIRLTKIPSHEQVREWNYDFSLCPDIAQTVMVTMAALGVKGKLSGLKTLRIKETDRIAAMVTELARIKTQLDVREKKGNISCILTGKAKWKDRAKFETYDDHRMAMAFAPLALLHPVWIRNPEVVSKSYPGFWEELKGLGVKCELVKIR